MSRLFATAAVAAFVTLGLSCGKRDGPGCGDLERPVDLSHSGADSAIVLTITSPVPLVSAAPGAGLQLFAQPPPDGTTTRFALTGRLTTSTTILTIGVRRECRRPVQWDDSRRGAAELRVAHAARNYRSRSSASGGRGGESAPPFPALPQTRAKAPLEVAAHLLVRPQQLLALAGQCRGPPPGRRRGIRRPAGERPLHYLDRAPTPSDTRQRLAKSCRPAPARR